VRRGVVIGQGTPETYGCSATHCDGYDGTIAVERGAPRLLISSAVHESTGGAMGSNSMMEDGCAIFPTCCFTLILTN
jgi:hypothetical protein